MSLLFINPFKLKSMNTEQIKKGDKFFTPTGVTFKITEVTDNRISFAIKSSFWGRNRIRLAWCTKKQFQKGIDKGQYKIKIS